MTQKETIEGLLVAGYTTGGIVSMVDVSAPRVRWIRCLLVRKNGPLICPCGKPGSHRGWCESRMKKSPAFKAWRARERASFVTRNLETQIIGHRTCTCCKEKKAIDNFYIRKQTCGIVKWREQCKQCLSEKSVNRWKNDAKFRGSALSRNRAWQYNNRAKAAGYSAAYRNRNPGEAIKSIGDGLYADNPFAFVALHSVEMFLPAPILDPLEALMAAEENEIKERRRSEAGAFTRFERSRAPMVSFGELLQEALA